MSKEKQIEEIANDINMHCCSLAEQFCGETSCNACLTNFLYNAGYRKQSEGEWIENPINNYDGEPSGLYYVCSVCHTDNGFEDTPFCPNCGAKMKGGEDNA